MRLHLFISGLVQGVNFRHYTVQTAQNLHLTGWVKNLSDGRVEILAEGTKNELEQLLRWCQKGPPAAQVELVKEKWSDAPGEFSDFTINR